MVKPNVYVPLGLAAVLAFRGAKRKRLRNAGLGLVLGFAAFHFAQKAGVTGYLPGGA